MYICTDFLLQTADKAEVPFCMQFSMSVRPERLQQHRSTHDVPAHKCKAVLLGKSLPLFLAIPKISLFVFGKKFQNFCIDCTTSIPLILGGKTVWIVRIFYHIARSDHKAVVCSHEQAQTRKH